MPRFLFKGSYQTWKQSKMKSTTEEPNSFTKLRTQRLEFREAEALGICRADLPE